MIFALDIGTRTVVGIVAEERENGIEILDFEVAEHEERAMLDGQINDVPKVSRTVEIVRHKLEERNGEKFSSVSTAVAGRFLKTVVGASTMKIPPSKIGEDFVRNLEFDALADAVQKNGHSKDYCVGYSILEYLVDGERVRNLIGQLGSEASVSLIAAFLPQRVVEALFSVVERTGLELDFLTLEPMAAMNLVVPPDLRRLNIALVDVGAGTSDIAISKNGTIMAYGMIPMAGDEITEKICDKYLLSFQDGERLKRSVASGDIPEVSNILGMPVKPSSEELMEIIVPVVNEITDEIAKTIFDLNGAAPAAVVIVGGGAKVPTFGEQIADKLSLPQNRVALRGIENLSYVHDSTGKVVGSEFVTPVGIAHSARYNISKIFKKISINSKTVQLMNLTGREDIFQALMQAGFDVKEIVGKPSAGITYEVNGKVMVESGKMPEPTVLINGKEASLYSRLNDGDVVEISPKDGEKVELSVRDVIETVNFFVSGEKYEIYPTVTKNSEEVSLQEKIRDGDIIEYDDFVTVEKAMEIMKKECFVTVNGKKHEIKDFELVDEEGKKLKRIRNGQRVEMVAKDVKLGDLLRDLKVDTISLTLNDKRMELKRPTRILLNGKIAGEEESIRCGDEIIVNTMSFKISDLFSQLHMNPNGFRIKVNGIPATLNELLKDGDSVEVSV